MCVVGRGVWLIQPHNYSVTISLSSATFTYNLLVTKCYLKKGFTAYSVLVTVSVSQLPLSHIVLTKRLVKVMSIIASHSPLNILEIVRY